MHIQIFKIITLPPPFQVSCLGHFNGNNYFVNKLNVS